jgi:GH24 family phage-related lysozyme (muramidase)
MEAILRPPLSPAPTTRPTRLVVGCVLILGMAAIFQRGEVTPTSTPIPPRQPQFALVSIPVMPDALTVQAQPLVDRAMTFIEPFEGRRHRAYPDARGYLTVGVGFNMDRAGAADDLDQLLPSVNYWALRRGTISLTDAQIDVLLRHDTRRAIDTARRQVAGFDSLAPDAQLIVIDMTFNTGSLHKWRDLRSALARQDYASAADAMHRSRWRRQTGQRARSLIGMMQALARG